MGAIFCNIFALLGCGDAKWWPRYSLWSWVIVCGGCGKLPFVLVVVSVVVVVVVVVVIA